MKIIRKKYFTEIFGDRFFLSLDIWTFFFFFRPKRPKAFGGLPRPLFSVFLSLFSITVKFGDLVLVFNSLILVIFGLKSFCLILSDFGGRPRFFLTSDPEGFSCSSCKICFFWGISSMISSVETSDLGDSRDFCWLHWGSWNLWKKYQKLNICLNKIENFKLLRETKL